MSPQDAITILENTSKLCMDIGTKGLAAELLEVIKVIQNLQYDAKVKADHHAKVLENIQIRNAEHDKQISDLNYQIFIEKNHRESNREQFIDERVDLEKKIAKLESEIQFRADEDAGDSL